MARELESMCACNCDCDCVCLWSLSVGVHIVNKRIVLARSPEWEINQLQVLVWLGLVWAEAKA